MARPLRIDFDGAFHHITNRGARGQPTFATAADRLHFYELLHKAFLRFGIVIHAFCFMDNHFHLIVETPRGNLSRAMHLVESCYVQGFNRRNGTNGPLYQDRFYSKLIQSDGYLYQAILYVMRNPLKAEIVTDLDNYPWSSYPYFMGNEWDRPEWLTTRGLEMGGIRSATDLRRVLHMVDPDDEIDLADYPQIVGTDSFIAAALARSTSDAETSSHVRGAQIRPTIDEVEAVVSAIFSAEQSVLRNPSSGRRSTARMAAILLSQELSNATLGAIADRYGFANPRSAGAIATRCRRKVIEDPVFAQQVEQVRQILTDGRPRAS